jgi:Domain of unknown function (DUF4124)
MKAMALLAVMVAFVAVSTGRADIIEWRDAQGIRHFTNNQAEVPTAAQARVVVTEPPPKPGSPSPPETKPSEAPHEAQVVYDYSQVTDAYERGLQQGLLLGRGGGSNAVSINGPLAIASARAPSQYPYRFYPPFDYPLVTTSFDRGRSRHLTLRLLLQDQFQLDREGPFRFERFPTGLGPNLNPFLPRGLPYGFPYGARVLF